MKRGGSLINQFISFIKTITSRTYFPLISTLFLFIVGLTLTYHLMTSSSLTIERDAVAIHKEPATSAEVVVPLEKDKQVHILSVREGWIQVRTDDHQIGWLPLWFLDNPSIDSVDNVAVEIKYRCPLYSEPNMNSTVITELPNNIYLKLIDESLGWVQVEYQGQKGFVPLENVQLLDGDQIPKSAYEPTPEESASIEEELAENEGIIEIRRPNQYLYDNPSFEANIIEDIPEGERVQYIENVDLGNRIEFYLVETTSGIRGYIDAQGAAFVNNYYDHVQEPIKKPINEATIVVDPGHGGSDPGAVSADETTTEKEITLATALLLQDELEARGANVVMTRDSDVDVPLSSIPDLSNEVVADAFISIHFDGSHDPSMHGTTTYYYHKADEELANAINTSVANLLQSNNGYHFGDYLILRENQRPAILLELGFMSNQNDFQQVIKPDYQRRAAQAIADGLEHYLEE